VKKDYTRDFFFDPVTGTYRDILDSIDDHVKAEGKHLTKEEKRIADIYFKNLGRRKKNETNLQQRSREKQYHKP